MMRSRQPVFRRSLGRCTGTGVRPRLRPSLVDWYLAVVDPLLIHPLTPETLLPSQRFGVFQRLHNLVRTKYAFAHGIRLTFGKCYQESCCADRKRRGEPLCESHGYVALAQDFAKAVGPQLRGPIKRRPRRYPAWPTNLLRHRFGEDRLAVLRLQVPVGKAQNLEPAGITDDPEIQLTPFPVSGTNFDKARQASLFFDSPIDAP
jgi:hypothetical protein